MKYVKMLGLAALSAMALMAFASTASATTLEVNGAAKNESVAIEATIKSGTSALLENTTGSTQNTCTTSVVKGATESPYTVENGAVKGPINTLSWSNCTRSVTVHARGSLSVEWTSGTNGNVYSEGAEVTVGAPIVGYLDCVTAEKTQIGTLTGAKTAEDHATMHINAVLDCGISGVWTGTYSVTSPTGLGVVE